MEKDGSEMPSDDGKANLDKNRRRTVKTPAQVQALEKFYEEHKYPTEEMKQQLAESIGLTEKQVSGWFCHRRLKDKRLMNGENHTTGRQDRLSGVIQDRVSGHRQDSCGSTKQGNERNLDTREVESGRLTTKEFSAPGLSPIIPNKNYNLVDDPSSGSSSSLRNMSNHQNVEPFDAATARHLTPKFPADVKGLKTRPGPSGYLKVKGRVENAAVTAVKRQLGKHYRDDGPPLGVDFDPLPPEAFESAMQEPVQGAYHTGEVVIPTSADAMKSHQDPKFGMSYEYSSSPASYIDRKSHKKRCGGDIPDSYINKKSGLWTSVSNGVAYYPGSNSFVKFPGTPDRHITGGHSRDEYETKPRPDIENLRIASISNDPHLQTYGGKVGEERFREYSDVYRENGFTDHSNPTMKRKECDRYSRDALLSGQPMKNDNRRAIDESRVKIPSNKKLNARKRLRGEFSPVEQQVLKASSSSVVDKLAWSDQIMRCGVEQKWSRAMRKAQKQVVQWIKAASKQVGRMTGHLPCLIGPSL
ncbi:homeobox-DDT domain protein RLT1 isoform X2 [Andrographis paniculata]|uniref:homeobox-DDT domain protein RLT1 isoform X2 n=1 Tax=Andrographis paniculata TaxID=175694 RepID=UPI0021E71B1C|nr:homeobox-DDT domain protein RLT1 isoform X2 [Andrographis paniculata]